MSELIDKQEAIDAMQKLIITDDEEGLMLMEYNQAVTDCIDKVAELPPATPAEKVGHCKQCKWWKDSDGAYRRGIRAESKCLMNTQKVYEGDGYCYLYEPKIQEVKE